MVGARYTVNQLSLSLGDGVNSNSPHVLLPYCPIEIKLGGAGGRWGPGDQERAPGHLFNNTPLPPGQKHRVIQEKHTIDGRNVEAKKVVPRDEQQTAQRTSNTAGPRTKKIFVGGLAPTVTEDDFRKYFEQFGNITDVVVMYDHTTQTKIKIKLDL
ncbi:heterogeneous nuclear ribonucleoprotein 1-like [Cryptomeria japonica]|uniref:heterogeneous nuclear ribonucleoprotein 1-like n=1 Tax=Cryptomeria japonica TaxID=3369 RepID=UPI0027D9E901|nr:heterogeneous nuclear ribonucleoprotein 1-like [Cryptomeria japonica]